LLHGKRKLQRNQRTKKSVMGRRRRDHASFTKIEWAGYWSRLHSFASCAAKRLQDARGIMEYTQRCGVCTTAMQPFANSAAHSTLPFEPALINVNKY
jgi:hypothetical protein